MPTVDINLWAVFAATAASMVIGSIWYATPVFGNMWLRMIGKTKEDLKGQGKAMWLMVVTAFVTSYVFAHVLDFSQADTWQEGLQGGFWMWLGFIATTTAADSIFGGKPWKLWLLNNGNYIVTLLVTGVIIAMWQ